MLTIFLFYNHTDPNDHHITTTNVSDLVVMQFNISFQFQPLSF